MESVSTLLAAGGEFGGLSRKLEGWNVVRNGKKFVTSKAPGLVSSVRYNSGKNSWGNALVKIVTPSHHLAGARARDRLKPPSPSLPSLRSFPSPPVPPHSFPILMGRVTCPRCSVHQSHGRFCFHCGTACLPRPQVCPSPVADPCDTLPVAE